MSYYRTFSPSEEKMEELRKIARKSLHNDLEDMKIELQMYCLLEHNPNDISNVIKHIRFTLNCMKWLIREECYGYAVNRYDTEEDKSVWYCGWKYSHGECEVEVDKVTNMVVENLVRLAVVVKSPDWFDDNEKFYEKIRSISDDLDYFHDEMSEYYDYEVMNELKEFEDKDDDYMAYKEGITDLTTGEEYKAPENENEEE